MSLVRDTKYSKEILAVLKKRGHATNAELITVVRMKFPDVSATTIHRASSRLLERSMIQEAPADTHGAMRFDSLLDPHDHFICSGCGGIRDIDIAEEFIPRISQALGGCKVTGRLVIHGSCEKCLESEG